MTAGKANKRPVAAMTRSILISIQFVSKVTRLNYGKRMEKSG